MVQSRCSAAPSGVCTRGEAARTCLDNVSSADKSRRRLDATAGREPERKEGMHRTAPMELSVPMPYLARVVTHVGERGVAPDTLLAGTPVASKHLAEPDGWVAFRTFVDVLLRAARLTGDPGLGLRLGLDTKPTANSWYGYALITASTVRDACELGIKYLAGWLCPWRVCLFVERDTAVMRFEEKLDLGEARQLVLEYFLGGAIRMSEFLHGHALAGSSLVFRASFPRPAHHAQFASQLPAVIYDCPVMEARHPASWLDRPLMLGDPNANRKAIAELERQVDGVAGDWTGRARALLADARNAYPDLAAAAKRLGLSERTLRRRLRDEGVTYRELREEARREAAVTRVARSRGPLASLARELGFASLAAFSRAFLRWTGEVPSMYRRKLRA